jgi:hypothetical protein
MFRNSTKRKAIAIVATVIAAASVAVGTASAGTYSAGGIGCQDTQAFQGLRVYAYAPLVKASGTQRETAYWSRAIYTTSDFIVGQATFTLEDGWTTWATATVSNYGSTKTFNYNGQLVTTLYTDVMHADVYHMVWNEVMFHESDGTWRGPYYFWSTPTSTSQAYTSSAGACY